MGTHNLYCDEKVPLDDVMALSRVSTCTLISSESMEKRLNKWANKRLKNPSTSRKISVDLFDHPRGVQDITHLFQILRPTPRPLGRGEIKL